MRLRTYTFHLPQSAVRGDQRALDRATIVADGFSWRAFAFTVFWFLWHRLWIAAILVAILLAGLAVAGRLLGFPPIAGFAIGLLASLLIGLEASSLRRWTNARRGRPARDAVLALSQDEAEAKLVARWLDGSGARTPAPLFGRRPDESVIGLFPSSESGR